MDGCGYPVGCVGYGYPVECGYPVGVLVSLIEAQINNSGIFLSIIGI